MGIKTLRIVLLVVFVFSFAGSSLFAQELNITGTVTEKATNDPIPGLTVYEKGSSNGVITDMDGKFKISAPKGTVLVFSFIGFANKEITIENTEALEIKMEQDLVAIEEVVAIGYGTQKKKEVTGAVAQVKSEDMAKLVASDFTKALQGQVAGVSVAESSGRPGDQANIQIRGLGSISGDSSPLYVVDGIPYEANPNIASEDIATVDILKDGAAAAVYGTRASNGVILITTKRGKVGKTKVSFASYYGIQNITSGTELLHTSEHIYVDEMQKRAVGSHSSIIDFNSNALDYDTDFVGAITEDNAPVQNYNFTISGGKEGLTFNWNTNYFEQDGILRQSGYDRFTTRANANFKKGKFSAFASMGIMHSNKEQEPWGLYEFAIYQGPYRAPLTDINSNKIVVSGGDPEHVGYLARILNQEDNRVEDSYNISTNIGYEIAPGLTYKLNIGYNNYSYSRKFWQPQFLVYDDSGNLNELGSRQDAILTQTNTTSRKLTIENVLSYSKTVGESTFSALLGYSREQTDKTSITTVGKNFLSNDVPVFNGARSITSVLGTENEHRMTGKLARLQYSYGGKYMVSGSYRYDGSSNFSSDNRYGGFSGISVGWNINEEDFMKSFTNIQNLKLRASYGEVGNEGISPYLYSAYVDSNVDYVWGPESSDELASGAIQRSYANSNVKWETNISRNIGLDLTMFRGKFTFNADYYQNDKQDMLLYLKLPPSTGTTIPNDYSNYDSKVSNVGNMTNKGFEFASTYKHHSPSGVDWNITATLTRNVNEIVSLGDNEEIALQDSKPGSWKAGEQDVTTYMRPGYTAGTFFLIPTDGIFNDAEELESYTNATTGAAIQPNAALGDVKYVDVNGDGVINDSDRIDQGSGAAEFEAGMTFSADYKGFDLSLQLFYSHGNKVYNGSKLFAYSVGRHEDLYDMWTPENPTSDIPISRASSQHDNYRTRSDYFLEDASFLRVRNISLGYTLPKSFLGGNIDHCRFYISGQNPFTFTKYDGYDPEIGGNGVSTRGIDKGSYPVTRKFIMGVQVDF